MSFTFLAAMGAESLADSFAEMFQSAPLKSISDAGKYYYNAKEMAFCLGSPFGIESKRLTAGRGAELPTWYRADFHAPTFHQPELTVTLTESNWELMEKALAYGVTWRELLARHNLFLSVLKTPPIYELKDLSESCATFPAWGMMQGGACLGVAGSVQTMCESECSLLPTPTAHNSKEGNYPAERTRNTPTLAASIGGKINPDWNEWRMGCPTKWSDLNPLEIDKFRQWLRSHGKP